MNYFKKVFNTKMFYGKKAVDWFDMDGNIIEQSETAQDCDDEKYMDYDVVTIPKIKLVLRKEPDDYWYIEDGFLGVFEDCIDIRNHEEAAAYILQELGIEENLVSIKAGYIDDFDDYKGLFVPLYSDVMKGHFISIK